MGSVERLHSKFHRSISSQRTLRDVVLHQRRQAETMKGWSNRDVLSGLALCLLNSRCRRLRVSSICSQDFSMHLIETGTPPMTFARGCATPPSPPYVGSNRLMLGFRHSWLVMAPSHPNHWTSFDQRFDDLAGPACRAHERCCIL